MNNSLSESSLDFISQPQYQTMDLAAYLDRKGLAQININGAPGSAAAIRFRGTSSDHTTLFWNGFSINSVSLGSADLSMIPLFFIDGATLINSPGAAKLPGSNIGAGVALNSSGAQAGNSEIRLIGSLNTLDNSFMGIDVPLTFRIAKKSSLAADHVLENSAELRVRTRVFDQHIENDFKYIDSYHFDKPVVRQRHNNGRAMGALSEVALLFGAHRFEFNNWYQQKKMDLPAIMGISDIGTAEQEDQIFRSSIAYKYTGKNVRLGVSTACFDDVSLFRDHLLPNGYWATDSRIHSRGILNRIDLSGSYKSIKYTVDGLSSYYDVKNVSYRNGALQKHWGQIGASVLYKVNHRHDFHSGIRYDIREVTSEPAYSFNYKLLRQSASTIPILELQVAKSYRHADFNERFWYPSGNSDLKPESGMNYLMNFGIQYVADGVLFIAKPSVFYSDIKNWIQWIPQTGSIWSPVNFKRVRSMGAELPVTLSVDWDKVRLQSEVRYSYTDSRGVNAQHWNSNDEFTMVYTPAHVLFCEITMRYKRINAGINNKYTSSRYTDESNSVLRVLPSFNLTGGYVSFLADLEKGSLECRLSADNLMDISYESVRAYAMPGRVFQFTINYRFELKK